MKGMQIVLKNMGKMAQTLSKKIKSIHLTYGVYELEKYDLFWIDSTTLRL